MALEDRRSKLHLSVDPVGTVRTSDSPHGLVVSLRALIEIVKMIYEVRATGEDVFAFEVERCFFRPPLLLLAANKTFAGQQMCGSNTALDATGKEKRSLNA